MWTSLAPLLHPELAAQYDFRFCMIWFLLFSLHLLWLWLSSPCLALWAGTWVNPPVHILACGDRKHLCWWLSVRWHSIVLGGQSRDRVLPYRHSTLSPPSVTLALGWLGRLSLIFSFLFFFLQSPSMGDYLYTRWMVRGMADCISIHMLPVQHSSLSNPVSWVAGWICFFLFFCKVPPWETFFIQDR